MLKSIHRPHHVVVYTHLRKLREGAELTQVQLAARFQKTQAWVSSVESGITRLDLVQLWEWCKACGSTLAGLAAVVEEELEAVPASRAKVARRASKATKARPKKPE